MNITDNIDKLINITEEVVYQNPDFEFTRNLANIKAIAASSCCCGVGVSGVVPMNLSNYGPGLASELARQNIYRNSTIPKPEFSSGVIR
jgi:hypothetical protein